MSRLRAALYLAFAVLLVLHQDFWFWDDPRFVAGLPVGLAYHVVYCLAAAVLFALLVRFAWPAGLDDGAEDGAP